MLLCSQEYLELSRSGLWSSSSENVLEDHSAMKSFSEYFDRCVLASVTELKNSLSLYTFVVFVSFQISKRECCDLNYWGVTESLRCLPSPKPYPCISNSMNVLSVDWGFVMVCVGRRFSNHHGSVIHDTSIMVRNVFTTSSVRMITFKTGIFPVRKRLQNSS